MIFDNFNTDDFDGPVASDYEFYTKEEFDKDFDWSIIPEDEVEQLKIDRETLRVSTNNLIRFKINTHLRQQEGSKLKILEEIIDKMSFDVEPGELSDMPLSVIKTVYIAQYLLEYVMLNQGK